MSDPQNEPPEPPVAAPAEPEAVAPSPAELDELRKKAAAHDELAGLVKRVQADFLNYQDRVRREREESRKFMIEDFLRQVLPALDALDKSMETLEGDGDARAVAEGIRIASRELMRVLERQGLQPVAAAGTKFNPALHEAIGTEPKEGVEPMTVTREVQRGYTLHGRLLRPARVLVAQPPADRPTAPSVAGDDGKTGR